VHERVEVLCRVKDQFPAACDWETVPEPPGTPKMLSVVVSQADAKKSKLRQSTIRRTLDLPGDSRMVAHHRKVQFVCRESGAQKPLLAAIVGVVDPRP